jgi:hypothetical protein
MNGKPSAPSNLFVDSPSPFRKREPVDMACDISQLRQAAMRVIDGIVAHSFLA